MPVTIDMHPKDAIALVEGLRNLIVRDKSPLVQRLEYNKRLLGANPNLSGTSKIWEGEQGRLTKQIDDLETWDQQLIAIQDAAIAQYRDMCREDPCDECGEPVEHPCSQCGNVCNECQRGCPICDADDPFIV